MPKAENAFEVEGFEVRILETKTDNPKKTDDDREPWLFLLVEAQCSNDVLVRLHPSLKSSFYQKANSDRQADVIENHLPELRFPFFKNYIKVERQLSGYTIDIEHGIDEKSHLNEDGVTLDRFKFLPLEGGTVKLAFRIGIRGLDDATHGALDKQKNEKITISLTAPEAEQGKLAA